MNKPELRTCLVQTDEGHLIWARTALAEHEGRMVVYIAWESLPDEYRAAIDGEHPKVVAVALAKEDVEVE